MLYYYTQSYKPYYGTKHNHGPNHRQTNKIIGYVLIYKFRWVADFLSTYVKRKSFWLYIVFIKMWSGQTKVINILHQKKFELGKIRNVSVRLRAFSVLGQMFG